MLIDVAELLDRGSWSRLGKVVTLLAAITIVFDGFDISIAGYSIPAILQEWHLTRAALSPLLIIGLIGMTIGASFAGVVGDYLGRRRALLISVLTFGILTAVSAASPNLQTLEILRFLAACGIGGAIPNATTLSAEFTPFSQRARAVMLTIVCVPLGGALAGSVARFVLPVAGWRLLFLIGGVAPILLVVVLFFFLPESPRFLARDAENRSALENLLQRLERPVPPGATLTETASDRAGKGVRLPDFFGSRSRDTLALWFAFFCSGACIYLCLSWLPALLTARGLNLSQASSGLSIYNWGGVCGVVAFALLVSHLGSRWLSLGTALGAVGMAALLMGSLRLDFAVLAALGFFANAVQTSLFALSAHLYPTRFRSTGVAAASAMGRIGAIGSALLGPLLIQSGPRGFFEFLAIAMLFALAGLALLRNHIRLAA